MCYLPSGFVIRSRRKQIISIDLGHRPFKAELIDNTRVQTVLVNGMAATHTCCIPLALHETAKWCHCCSRDARATVGLLLAVADLLPGDWAAGANRHHCCGLGPGSDPRRPGFVHEPTPHLSELARDIHPEPDVASYAVLLDRALADLRLTDDERIELDELARDSGLSAADVARAHRGFLTDLVDTALEDGIVTDDEIDKLVRVAALLGLDPDAVTARTNPYRFADEVLWLEPGVTVCFTGDADAAGQPLSRDELHAIATAHGLTPVDSVTAKGCQLLVAADPATLSGKAKAAHKFGIPIAALDDFLTADSAHRQLPVTVLRRHGVASVCEQCGDSWTATRRARRCPSCRRGPATTQPVDGTPPTPHSGIDILVCIDCAQSWERPRSRGRRPHRCPDCAAAIAM